MKQKTRRDVLRLIGGATGVATLPGWVSLTGCSEPEPPRGPPNIVVMMADDLGYQDLGCYGSPDIETPHLDRLTRQGARFTDFYAAPMCTAARAAFMTGCYARRVGDLKRTGVGTRVGLNDEELTLAELLREAGYSTHLVGKWHLGMHPKFSPLAHGFDSFYGMLTSNGQDPPLMRGHEVEEPEPDQALLTERYEAEAVTIIRREKERPFFLFLSPAAPHVPLHVSERWRGRSARGPYGDSVECLDWACGRVLDELDQQGIADRTLVVFCSDNGPWLLKGESGGSAAPLRGGKGQIYEGGVRVPCIMRYPALIPAGHETSEVCGLNDLLPTFAALAGAPLPSERIIDGRDIEPLLSGRADARSPHEHWYFFRGSNLKGVRAGRYKLHVAGAGPGARPRLYDLERDIAESHDIAAAHPDVVASLTDAIARFDEQITAEARAPGRAAVSS